MSQMTSGQRAKQKEKDKEESRFRQYMDRRLEREGLLNYQTRGLSAGDISARYQQAGIKTNNEWMKQQYGGNQGQVYQQPQYLPPQNPNIKSNLPGEIVGQGNTLLDPVTGKPYYSPGVQYAVNNENGLLVRQRNETVWLNGNPEERNVKPSMNLTGGGIATVQDALNGTANWNDVEIDQRKKILSDPSFYKTNQITKYPKWMQQEILADPNFDWSQLPSKKILGMTINPQEMYYKLSSSPAGMGAVQGFVMGAGNLGGAAVGAALGWLAGKSGYDPVKEAWEQGSTSAKAFGLLNWAAEQAEKGIGMGVQTVQAARDPNMDVKDVFTQEGWQAGTVTFETLAPAYSAAWEDGRGKLEVRDLLWALPVVKVVDVLWR